FPELLSVEHPIPGMLDFTIRMQRRIRIEQSLADCPSKERPEALVDAVRRDRTIGELDAGEQSRDSTAGDRVARPGLQCSGLHHQVPLDLNHGARPNFRTLVLEVDREHGAERLSAACARASSFSANGSWPRRTRANKSLAIERALLRSSAVTGPS